MAIFRQSRTPLGCICTGYLTHSQPSQLEGPWMVQPLVYSTRTKCFLHRVPFPPPRLREGKEPFWGNLTMWLWLKIKELGLRRIYSLAPFAKGAIWYIYLSHSHVRLFLEDLLRRCCNQHSPFCEKPCAEDTGSQGLYDTQANKSCLCGSLRSAER